MTMMAFDADDPATDNAALRYNIVRQSPGHPSSNMFYIDAERGDIVTAIPAMLLDREVSSVCFPSLHLGPLTRGETTAAIASAAGVWRMPRHRLGSPPQEYEPLSDTLARALIEAVHSRAAGRGGAGARCPTSPESEKPPIRNCWNRRG